MIYLGFKLILYTSDILSTSIASLHNVDFGFSSAFKLVYAM